MPYIPRAGGGTSIPWIATAGEGYDVTKQFSIDADGTNDQSVSIGHGANGSTVGVALGEGANGSDSGMAIGAASQAIDSGVAVGRSALASTEGVALGRDSNADTEGVAIGYATVGNNTGVAIGKFADGHGIGNVAIGGDDGDATAAIVPDTFEDTVQLGRGTATVNGGLHFRDKLLVDYNAGNAKLGPLDGSELTNLSSGALHFSLGNITDTDPESFEFATNNSNWNATTQFKFRNQLDDTLSFAGLQNIQIGSYLVLSKGADQVASFLVTGTSISGTTTTVNVTANSTDRVWVVSDIYYLSIIPVSVTNTQLPAFNLGPTDGSDPSDGDFSTNDVNWDATTQVKINNTNTTPKVFVDFSSVKVGNLLVITEKSSGISVSFPITAIAFASNIVTFTLTASPESQGWSSGSHCFCIIATGETVTMDTGWTANTDAGDKTAVIPDNGSLVTIAAALDIISAGAGAALLAIGEKCKALETAASTKKLANA